MGGPYTFPRELSLPIQWQADGAASSSWVPPSRARGKRGEEPSCPERSGQAAASGQTPTSSCRRLNATLPDRIARRACPWPAHFDLPSVWPEGGPTWLRGAMDVRSTLSSAVPGRIIAGHDECPPPCSVGRSHLSKGPCLARANVELGPQVPRFAGIENGVVVGPPRLKQIAAKTSVRDGSRIDPSHAHSINGFPGWAATLRGEPVEVSARLSTRCRFSQWSGVPPARSGEPLLAICPSSRCRGC